MIRRLVVGLVATLVIVAGLGAIAPSAHASTPMLMPGRLQATTTGAGSGVVLREFSSPSPAASAEPSSASSPDFSTEPTPAEASSTPAPQNQPSGPPGWLLILIGIAILIFTFSGGATRLATRFQQPPPP